MRRAIRQVIESEYRDSDGYWIDLKPGWQNGADPGTHAVHEDTKKAAYSTLEMVKPCECADCKGLLARQAAAGGAK